MCNCSSNIQHRRNLFWGDGQTRYFPWKQDQRLLIAVTRQTTSCRYLGQCMSCISPELEPLSLALANLISLSPRALSSFIRIGVPHKLKTHNQALDSLLLRTSLLQSTPHEPKALALLRQCEGCSDTAQPEAEPLHPQSPMSM